jgi:serine/threonine protein kinase
MEPGMSRVSDAALGSLRALVSDGALDAGRYALQEVLGEGGMGTVYRAQDAELEREVAVKVLRFPGNPEWVERFRQEARTIAALEHPGIVPVHDAGTLADGRVFYVMKLVRGSRLRDEFARTSHSIAQRLDTFLRVCDAVAFAHSHRIVHRDLKPENIMLGPFGEVLVIDWGVAISLAPGQRAEGVIAGTPGFMAPEQAQGDATIDHRADVYALGGLLESMLPKAIPRPLAAIASRARAQCPEDRYQSVEALAADVTRFRDGNPVEAYRESLPERLARVYQRYRLPIILVAVYMIMRTILLLWLRV